MNPVSNISPFKARSSSSRRGPNVSLRRSTIASTEKCNKEFILSQNERTKKCRRKIRKENSTTSNKDLSKKDAIKNIIMHSNQRLESIFKLFIAHWDFKPSGTNGHLMETQGAIIQDRHGSKKFPAAHDNTNAGIHSFTLSDDNTKELLVPLIIANGFNRDNSTPRKVKMLYGKRILNTPLKDKIESGEINTPERQKINSQIIKNAAACDPITLKNIVTNTSLEKEIKQTTLVPRDQNLILDKGLESFIRKFTDTLLDLCINSYITPLHAFNEYKTSTKTYFKRLKKTIDSKLSKCEGLISIIEDIESNPTSLKSSTIDTLFKGLKNLKEVGEKVNPESRISTYLQSQEYQKLQAIANPSSKAQYNQNLDLLKPLWAAVNESCDPTLNINGLSEFKERFGMFSRSINHLKTNHSSDLDATMETIGEFKLFITDIKTRLKSIKSMVKADRTGMKKFSKKIFFNKLIGEKQPSLTTIYSKRLELLGKKATDSKTIKR